MAMRRDFLSQAPDELQQTVLSLVQSGDDAGRLVEACNALEGHILLGNLMAAEDVEVFSAVHLLAHLAADDLVNAKHLWQRCGHLQESPQMRAAWELGMLLYKGELAEFFTQVRDDSYIFTAKQKPANSIC